MNHLQTVRLLCLERPSRKKIIFKYLIKTFVIYIYLIKIVYIIEGEIQSLSIIILSTLVKKN